MYEADRKNSGQDSGYFGRGRREGGNEHTGLCFYMQFFLLLKNGFEANKEKLKFNKASWWVCGIFLLYYSEFSDCVILCMCIVVNIGNKYYFIFMYCVHLHTSHHLILMMTLCSQQSSYYCFYSTIKKPKTAEQFVKNWIGDTCLFSLDVHGNMLEKFPSSPATPSCLNLGKALTQWGNELY